MKFLNGMKSLISAEIIRASTPIFIAAIGGVIALTALSIKTDTAKNAFGLASTAIAGAAGLAQPHKTSNQKDE